MEALKRYIETRELLFKQADIAPKSNFVNINTERVKRVHYLELGSGTPLVLIHGGLGHSSDWFPILKQLSEHFHLYIVDRPGHGLTDPIDYSNVNFQQAAVDFVSAFMDSVGLKKASLLGNSMGGFFSICFGLSYPERVDKLILIGAPAGLNRWIPPMLRLMGVRPINKLLAKTIAKPSVMGTKKIYEQVLVANVDNLPQVYFEHGFYHMLLPNIAISQRTMLENVLNIRGWKEEYYLTDKLDQLTPPVHFIWGSQDAFEKPDAGIVKASKINNYTFEIVENAGHCPWLDEPNKCSSLIIEKIEK